MPSLADLKSIGLLDSAPEPDFDRVVQLAARLLGSEVSILTVIDQPGQRQFFKALHGTLQSLDEITETPLSHSFCKSVVELSNPTIISDAHHDPKYKTHPAVIDYGVAAYLGVPVIDDRGYAVASLCALSTTPKSWTPQDVDTLETLATGLSNLVRLRLALQQSNQLATQLDTLNKRFQDLAENVPGAIFRYILHTDGSDEVEYMSPGCLKIWEVSASDIEKNAARLWEIIIPEDLVDMQTSIRRSADQMIDWEHRWRVETPSGKKKWLQGYAKPRKLENGSILWNSLILDVTVEAEAERKSRENARLFAQSQKQESIGRLAGGVAHDFNNLLAIILGNAEILLDGRSREPIKDLLADIIYASKRGSDLTKSLLSFARKSDLKPEFVDVNKSIGSMHNLFRRTLSERIEINTTLMAGLWPVLADRSALESALLNLVLNSRDAMPNGGALTIETANVRIIQDYVEARHEDISPGRYVLIAVSDTGSGIAAELLEKAFEPFVTTKGPEHGTGLGLAMVQGFAKQSGGTVRIYSEPGHGTSLKIYLPATELVGSFEEDRPNPIDVGGTERILLVEDNPAVRRSIRRSLETAGYEVLEAASGDAAWRMIETSDPKFDLILTDVVMPGKLQGPELVQSVRKRLPNIPVIFTSGYPHEANVHGNGIRPTDVSLTKPVARADLLTALSRALSSRR